MRTPTPIVGNRAKCIQTMAGVTLQLRQPIARSRHSYDRPMTAALPIRALQDAPTFTVVAQ